VSIDALCNANDLVRSAVLKPKQKLIIPTADDPDGSAARALEQRGFLDDPNPRPSAKAASSNEWRRYATKPWRRGYITLRSGDKQWRGYVLGPRGTLLPAATKNISDVLASWRTGKRVDIDRGLIRLIARVSDTFGGRPIRVVSGFREHSYVPSSRHPQGRALDFSIDGVPNEAVRDYLRTLAKVGVGYYPNSSFVHADTRDAATYWIDYSGPGEPPEIAGN
jgi:hypothetical protein